MKCQNALRLNAMVVGIVLSIASLACVAPASAANIEVDEFGSMLINGQAGPQATNPQPYISGMVFSLPFAGNPGEILLMDPNGATDSDLIRFTGDGKMTFFSFADHRQPLAAAAAAGDTNIKIASVSGLSAGQTILVDQDGATEVRTIANVGTAGATGTGVTLTSPLTTAHASGSPTAIPNAPADVVEVLPRVPTGITLNETGSELTGTIVTWTPGAANIGGNPADPGLQYIFHSAGGTVPEPTSFASLTALALLGGVARRRLRRRAASNDSMTR